MEIELHFNKRVPDWEETNLGLTGTEVRPNGIQNTVVYMTELSSSTSPEAN